MAAKNNVRKYDDIQDVFKDPSFDTKVEIYGTIETKRKYGKIMFLIIRDCTSTIQMIFRQNIIPNLDKSQFKRNDRIRAIGILKKDARAINDIDLEVEEYYIIKDNQESSVSSIDSFDE